MNRRTILKLLASAPLLAIPTVLNNKQPEKKTIQTEDDWADPNDDGWYEEPGGDCFAQMITWYNFEQGKFAILKTHGIITGDMI